MTDTPNQADQPLKCAERERNRELMPNVATMLDELRKAGFTFKVLAAEDFVTGHRVGDLEEKNPCRKAGVSTRLP